MNIASTIKKNQKSTPEKGEHNDSRLNEGIFEVIPTTPGKGNGSSSEDYDDIDMETHNPPIESEESSNCISNTRHTTSKSSEVMDNDFHIELESTKCNEDSLDKNSTIFDQKHHSSNKENTNSNENVGIVDTSYSDEQVEETIRSPSGSSSSIDQNRNANKELETCKNNESYSESDHEVHEENNEFARKSIVDVDSYWEGLKAKDLPLKMSASEMISTSAISQKVDLIDELSPVHENQRRSTSEECRSTNDNNENGSATSSKTNSICSSANSSINNNSDHEENENENTSGNDFIDDEAMCIKDYESGDSMDSEERSEARRNEIPDYGEYINSSSPRSEETDEEILKNDSFICDDESESFVENNTEDDIENSASSNKLEEQMEEEHSNTEDESKLKQVNSDSEESKSDKESEKERSLERKSERNSAESIESNTSNCSFYSFKQMFDTPKNNRKEATNTPSDKENYLKKSFTEFDEENSVASKCEMNAIESHQMQRKSNERFLEKSETTECSSPEKLHTSINNMGSTKKLLEKRLFNRLNTSLPTYQSQYEMKENKRNSLNFSAVSTGKSIKEISPNTTISKKQRNSGRFLTENSGNNSTALRETNQNGSNPTEIDNVMNEENDLSEGERICNAILDRYITKDKSPCNMNSASKEMVDDVEPVVAQQNEPLKSPESDKSATSSQQITSPNIEFVRKDPKKLFSSNLSEDENINTENILNHCDNILAEYSNKRKMQNANNPQMPKVISN